MFQSLMKAGKSRTQATRSRQLRSRFRPELGQLEGRQLLTASGHIVDVQLIHGTLVIDGTNYGDNVTVEQQTDDQSGDQQTDQSDDQQSDQSDGQSGDQQDSQIVVTQNQPSGGGSFFVPQTWTFDSSEVHNIKFYGHGGNDKFVSNYHGPTTAYGDSGKDILDCSDSDGSCHLYGGSGDDWCYGGSGYDWIDGGSGNDHCYGGYGNDKVFGGSGNDWCYGGYGNDKVYGGSGNDHCYGDQGNDWCYGQQGNDWCYGGSGSNHFDGGPDFDQYYNGNSSQPYHKSQWN